MRDTKALEVFGNHIRNIRLQRNLTQEDVAKLCCIDRNYIGMLERGERNPSFLSLLKLAQGLNISLKELFDY